MARGCFLFLVVFGFFIYFFHFISLNSFVKIGMVGGVVHRGAVSNKAKWDVTAKIQLVVVKK